MKRYMKWVYLTLVVTTFLIWFEYFRLEVDLKKPKIYSVLIKQVNQKIEKGWVLFYFYPKNYFYLFEIDEKTHLQSSTGKLFESIYKDEDTFKKNISLLYGLNRFDDEVTISSEESMSILSSFGGVSYFNRFSSKFRFGEVYINDQNYQSFTEGISDPYRRKDEKLGVWVNLLLNNFDRMSGDGYIDILMEALYDKLNLSYNYKTFRTLLDPLVKKNEKKIRDRFFFSFGKNNLEEVEDSEGSFLVPFQNGKYDRNKILEKLSFIRNQNWKKENFPISVQVNNHTRENRLAAKTAGYLRLRRLNVVEYVGSTSLLEQSLLLDYSFNPNKRRYMKKVSRVDRLYFMFDYREHYDYSLYLGSDFFGITNK